MSELTYLVTVSGPDRVGVGAELFAALASLAPAGANLSDVAQITIRNALILCGEITTSQSLSAEQVRAALLERNIVGEGINVQIEVVTNTTEVKGGRTLVTLLAPSVSAGQLHQVFAGIARSGSTCERIVHLAKNPVDCYELVIRSPRPDELRIEMSTVGRSAGLDVAVQREGLHRRSKHLVVMDADSTLLQDEVIDLLAEGCGCDEAVKEITERAMAGELDFSQSLRERVALLKGLDESVLDEVRAKVRFTPGAETLVRTLLHLGYVPAVVSGGFEQILAPLMDQIGVKYLRANTLEVLDGVLTGQVIGEIVDRPGKARALEDFALEVGVPLEQTVAVGDGANDIDMLSVAGLGIAFNAKPLVQEHADAALSVPYLDAVLYFLGISRDEIEQAKLG